MINMLPQYIDIATRADLLKRSPKLVDHKGDGERNALMCVKLSTQWKLRDTPSCFMDNAFETWIPDPEKYDPAINSDTVWYRLGMVPLADHLNRLMRLNLHKWVDQPLVQIDDYWFKLGDWRWKYDVPRNKLLMCVDGPAAGDYTETLI